ncbi:5193_t:CDS:1, partial [Scutellospora calospora]
MLARLSDGYVFDLEKGGQGSSFERRNPSPISTDTPPPKIGISQKTTSDQSSNKPKPINDKTPTDKNAKPIHEAPNNNKPAAKDDKPAAKDDKPAPEAPNHNNPAANNAKLTKASNNSKNNKPVANNYKPTKTSNNFKNNKP